jgi:NAD(P)H-dependent FMN reductase
VVSLGQHAFDWDDTGAVVGASHSVNLCFSLENGGQRVFVGGAIDWASRPHGDSAWSGKSAAIMGASPRAIGNARAQYHLRQILVGLNLFPLNLPEVTIADAARRFDENGNLIHEPTKQLIQEQLENLVDWTRRLSPTPA